MRGESVMDDTPASDKKPVKKRKSWGQQLPEPKTNLPPRKRAKTEDEKEQRRVERVLRNRRAAQSSRERKRLEVEALDAVKQQLERRVKDMELQLANERTKRLEAERELELERAANGKNMTVFRGSSPAHSEHSFRQAPSPVTLSQELFSSRDARPSISTQFSVESETTVQTVNPASLSPEIRPVTESNASSSDMTQHPAAMLCDLQCQSEEQRPWVSTTGSHQMMAYIMAIALFNTTMAASLTLLNPLIQICTSLRTGSSLLPTPSILTLIIWLTTTTAPLTTSISTISSTTTKTTSPRPMLSLRIRLLNQLLSCSPQLARPLMDATMAAMRLASEQQLARDCLTGVGSSDRLDGRNSPSLESLMTLLWATQIFEKKSKNEQVGRQTYRELDELFRAREVIGTSEISSVSGGGGGAKKSLGEWRSADRP